MNIFPKPHGYFWEWGRGTRPKRRNGDLAQAFDPSLSYPRAPERGAQVEPQNLPPRHLLSERLLGWPSAYALASMTLCRKKCENSGSQQSTDLRGKQLDFKSLPHRPRL